MPDGSRRDPAYCDHKCRGLASSYRRKAGIPPPLHWQHPALNSDNPALRSAAAHAKQLGETNGWSPSLIRCAMDGLTAVLEDRPPGKPIKLTEVRTRIPRHASSHRVAEVLTDLDLLEDDSALAIRSWIDDRTAALPAGFASDVRAWLLVLLDGDSRAKPRSHTCLYVHFGCVRPLLENWAATRGHLREITATDVTVALSPLRGWQRRNTIAALRSLFRFAKKRGLIFANPTVRLKSEDIQRNLLPMTETEVLAVQRVAITPAQRMIVALAAVHAARATAIRHLTLDDLDLPNRRITIAGHAQRLGELPHQTLLAWLAQRGITWPKTPNRHVLINAKTALGTGPVSAEYLKRHLLRQGVHLERIRGDRVLHEALTVGSDPLHLALVFNLSHTTASRYATIAQNLLDDQI
ncbi:hypothetical protein [Streptomyces sp. NBC_01320]|uniref:hypothetical protein n=1 Tax=Streptomyces sp. NBC_01320 TaxID=2903824 RepID=UPI002E0D60C2|nr:hypothetical protein OG395_50490 [Streptomyces sp. NBC_01320]